MQSGKTATNGKKQICGSFRERAPGQEKNKLEARCPTPCQTLACRGVCLSLFMRGRMQDPDDIIKILRQPPPNYFSVEDSARQTTVQRLAASKCEVTGGAKTSREADTAQPCFRRLTGLPEKSHLPAVHVFSTSSAREYGASIWFLRWHSGRVML